MMTMGQGALVASLQIEQSFFCLLLTPSLVSMQLVSVRYHRKGNVQLRHEKNQGERNSGPSGIFIEVSWY